jgi:diguanylate cyclase (GGDEF)-like protein
MGLEHLLAEYRPARYDTPLQRFVQGLVLAPEEEIAQALRAPGPCAGRGAPRHPVLARLATGDEYVLAVVRPHGHTLGLLYADDLYSRAPLTADRLSYFGFFVSQTAIAWENLSLLRRVEALARYDSLTGVFNRREFEARFRDEQSRCQRSGSTCSLMIMDVDRFKQLNDRHGHQAGDAALARLGAVLRSTLRAHDVVARFGGDEFVLLLPDTGAGELAGAARRVGALAQAEAVSVSIGGATWPDDCAEPPQLLGAADANLYRAKRSGRGRACIGRRTVRFGVDQGERL